MIRSFAAAGGEEYLIYLRNMYKRGEAMKFNTLAECFAWRDFIYAYMDVSQPLPDIPDLEACRLKDPVTRAHDGHR